MVDKDTQAVAMKEQLALFGSFLDDYGKRLDAAKANPFQEGPFSPSSAASPFSLLRAPPSEQLPVAMIVDDDNKMLSKVLLALTELCSEMDSLSDDDALGEFADLLLFYGEADSAAAALNSAPIHEGDTQVSLARFLPTLQRVSSFHEHCQKVVGNVVEQLCALHSTDAVIHVGDAYLRPVHDRLAKVYSALVALDEVIRGNLFLADHWSAYLRMVRAAANDPARFGVAADKMRRLEKVLAPLGDKLFGQGLFMGLVSHVAERHGAAVRQNRDVQNAFLNALRAQLSEAENNISNNDFNGPPKILGVCAVLVMFANLASHMPDKRFMSRLWDLIRGRSSGSEKCPPGATLHGNAIWFPDQFLLSCMPAYGQTVDRKLLLSVTAGRQTYLQNRAQNAAADVRNFHSQFNDWVVKMETLFRRPSPAGNPRLDGLDRQTGLLIRGLRMASEVRQVVANTVNLHQKLSAPLTKTSVTSLCKMLELLKAVESTFHRHSLRISEVCAHATQHLAYVAIANMEKAKRFVVSERRNAPWRADVVSALGVAERAVAGAATRRRRTAAEVAFAIAAQNKTFTNEENEAITSSFSKLSVLSDLRGLVASVCDCSFVYWHRIMVGVHLQSVYENKGDVNRLHYLFSALQDCAAPLKRAAATAATEATAACLSDAFEADIRRMFRDRVLDPLCKDIETDLRLHVHSHLRVGDGDSNGLQNPFKSGNSASICDLSTFLQVTPIRFMDKYINIKAYIISYLEKMFYNLTTVALHNWRTYGEMRALAEHKFAGLETVDDRLPAQTLEQGLDVLEIMRNIDVFVSRYIYNLNNQIFVEAESDNKHLNTISIRHVANSIRTHGAGIMNTAVNFTYQFLRKKFVIFSQFLYDEHIKSRLIRDIRHFRENKSTLGQKYPFERASKFNRAIRKLGLMPDGATYLDQFRILVSHIGNAMGYVRMIRSGGLRSVSESVAFVPELEGAPTFGDLCAAEDLSEESVKAGEMLDKVVENLRKNFSEGTEYFQLLVEVFSSRFGSSKHAHLRRFYAIVPPLTVNYVDHVVAAKEKIGKKRQLHQQQDRAGAGGGLSAFTDDGFAMGLAYILRLLNQYPAFDSLHWFQSVSEHHAEERARVEERARGAGADDKLRQTLALTLKRLATHQKEYDLLYYGLSSARIFFRPKDAAEDEERDVNKDEAADEAENDDGGSVASSNY